MKESKTLSIEMDLIGRDEQACIEHHMELARKMLCEGLRVYIYLYNPGPYLKKAFAYLESEFFVGYFEIEVPACLCLRSVHFNGYHEDFYMQLLESGIIMRDEQGLYVLPNDDNVEDRSEVTSPIILALRETITTASQLLQKLKFEGQLEAIWGLDNETDSGDCPSEIDQQIEAVPDLADALKSVEQCCLVNHLECLTEHLCLEDLPN